MQSHSRISLQLEGRKEEYIVPISTFDEIFDKFEELFRIPKENIDLLFKTGDMLVSLQTEADFNTMMAEHDTSGGWASDKKPMILCRSKFIDGKEEGQQVYGKTLRRLEEPDLKGTLERKLREELERDDVLNLSELLKDEKCQQCNGSGKSISEAGKQKQCR